MNARKASPFSPYEVVDTEVTIENIFLETNAKIFNSYCQTDSITKLEPLWKYRELLERLRQLNIDIVPFVDADINRPPPAGRAQCLIRHDLDVDIVTALKMAEIEHELGVRSSWYILHTAPYYGHFTKRGIFNRNQSMRHVYRQLEVLGHEVALHTDGLCVYQNHRRNGAQAIEREIDWLRSSGINLRGSTAHNSWGIYGAENFALFKGKPLRGGTRAGECPAGIQHNGCYTPLQNLSERELGLSYEANEFFWQSHTTVRYAAIRSADNWRWSDKQSRANTNPSGAREGFQNTDVIFDNLSKVKPGEWLVLVVHPIYYGHRHASYAAPRSIP